MFLLIALINFIVSAENVLSAASPQAIMLQQLQDNAPLKLQQRTLFNRINQLNAFRASHNTGSMTTGNGVAVSGTVGGNINNIIGKPGGSSPPAPLDFLVNEGAYTNGDGVANMATVGGSINNIHAGRPSNNKPTLSDLAQHIWNSGAVTNGEGVSNGGTVAGEVNTLHTGGLSWPFNRLPINTMYPASQGQHNKPTLATDPIGEDGKPIATVTSKAPLVFNDVWEVDRSKFDCYRMGNRELDGSQKKVCFLRKQFYRPNQIYDGHPFICMDIPYVPTSISISQGVDRYLPKLRCHTGERPQEESGISVNIPGKLNAGYYRNPEPPAYVIEKYGKTFPSLPTMKDLGPSYSRCFWTSSASFIGTVGIQCGHGEGPYWENNRVPAEGSRLKFYPNFFSQNLYPSMWRPGPLYARPPSHFLPFGETVYGSAGVANTGYIPGDVVVGRRSAL